MATCFAILTWLPCGMCCGCVPMRTPGYYPRNKLATEEEVYAQFMADEDARLEVCFVLRVVSRCASYCIGVVFQVLW